MTEKVSSLVGDQFAALWNSSSSIDEVVAKVRAVDPSARVADLLLLLEPLPGELFDVVKVGPAITEVGDGPQCLAPAARPGRLSG